MRSPCLSEQFTKVTASKRRTLVIASNSARSSTNASAFKLIPVTQNGEKQSLKALKRRPRAQSGSLLSVIFTPDVRNTSSAAFSWRDASCSMKIIAINHLVMLFPLNELRCTATLVGALCGNHVAKTLRRVAFNAIGTRVTITPRCSRLIGIDFLSCILHVLWSELVCATIQHPTNYAI